MPTHTAPPSYTPSVSKDSLHELFFTQSLDGFFIMMLEAPIDWNDAADKEAILDYVFEHQHITIANEALAKPYDLPLSNFIGMTPAQLFAHDLPAGRAAWRAMFDEGHLHTETDERRGDGTPMRIEGHYLCIRDESGRITGHLGIQRDITERHESAEEVAHSRKELRVLAAHLETVREEERRRIARELHDELGQKMTAFKLDLGWLERRLARDQSSDVTDHMHALLRRLDGVMIAVQRIITELRPSLLDLLGLADAIESYARDFAARTDLELDLAIETDGTLVPDPIATAVFRMLQEALNNIARHAGARRVGIELRNVVGILSLVVADDGRGITESQLRGDRSLGILGLRERAIASGGSLDIHGESGRGTTVSLQIPLRCAIT